MKQQQKSLNAIDFFCGGGGMSLGMRRAGINVIAGIDNDPKCRETYEVNHKESQFIQADIKQYPIANLAADTGIRCHDNRMLFIGCSPCQYWSVITGRCGSDRKYPAHDSRNLLFDFLDFVDYYRPGFVVIENVRGIERHPQESGLQAMLDFFSEASYKFNYAVLSANEYGVPQTRQRFILLATRVLDAVSMPKPGRSCPTVADSIGGKNRLPGIKAGERDHRDPLHKSPSLSDINIERLNLTPEGGFRACWQHRDDLLTDAYRNMPNSFFRENHGRMAWEKPAPTITTQFHKLSSGRFAHPVENRAISLREGAMLQTFPKSYKFKTTSFTHTARIIGNAVPPKFAEKIGRHLVKQLT